MDMLQEARPEIIDGVTAIGADGQFTEIVALHSDHDTREGERQEMLTQR